MDKVIADLRALAATVRAEADNSAGLARLNLNGLAATLAAQANSLSREVR